MTHTSTGILLAVVAATLGLSGCGGADGAGGTTPSGQPAGLAAYQTIYTVLQHPRCLNCHPAADVPRQGDESVVHTQNVIRGPEGRGVAGAECTSCHGPANLPASYGEHTPPGVSTGWHMPPENQRMIFFGMSPPALCAQIKDPARNGGKDMAALFEHLHDPLVMWGWDPGLGREPVSIAYEVYVAAWKTWSEAGAPCPE